MQDSVITCQKCGTSRFTPSPFLDLGLMVLGLNGVNESLESMFAKELFNGDNQLTCDNCNEKTDSAKYVRFSRLPPILTFSLNRFELDYQTWQRKKVNQRFEFPLEVDLYKYTKEAEEETKVDPE